LRADRSVPYDPVTEELAWRVCDDWSRAPPALPGADPRSLALEAIPLIEMRRVSVRKERASQSRGRVLAECRRRCPKLIFLDAGLQAAFKDERNTMAYEQLKGYAARTGNKILFSTVLEHPESRDLYMPGFRKRERKREFKSHWSKERLAIDMKPFDSFLAVLA